MSLLGTEEAHRAWMELATGIDVALDGVAAAKDIEEQREGFVDLSGKMTRLVRTFGPPDGTVYEIECPMAFGHGARWLQETDEILNPYMGPGMLRCGEVVDRSSLVENGDE